MEVHPQPQPASPKRKYNEHSDDLRACIVRLRDSHMSWKRVATLAGVPESTARDIVRTATKEGRTSKRHKGGNHKPVISDTLKQLVCDLQAADNTLRLQDIHHLLDAVTLQPLRPLS